MTSKPSTRIRLPLPLRRVSLVTACALGLALAACGGGGGSDGATPAPSTGGDSQPGDNGSTGGGGSGGTGSGGGGSAGGGDSGTPTTVQRSFTGVVRSADATVAAGTVVCADRNADLVCGTGEEQTTVDANGGFTLAAAVADANATPTWPLVAVVPISTGDNLAVTSTQTHYSLAAAADAAVIDAVSTLAWAGVGNLGLAAGLDLHSATDAQAVRVRSIVHPALVQTVSTLRDRQADTAVAQLTRTASASLGKVAPGYVDPDTGLFLRTVTPRTLRAEAVHDAVGSGQTCSHAPIPSFNIATAGGAAIVSKDDYLDATLTVSGAGLTATEHATQIRGRGNSTWELDKKPYRLKLARAAALLGLPAERDWVLLANHIDKSLLRNDLTFCMGRMLGFDFTPASRHVEVTLNGDYIGVYQLTDQIETGRYRVNIDEDEAQTDAAALAFMLEIDWRQDEDYNITTALDSVPYMVKSDIAAAQEPLIAGYLNEMEAALNGANLLDANTGYGRWMDASTLVDLYLINELSRNGDAFTSSAYTWRAGHGLLNFGPLWDFDIAYGNASYRNETFQAEVDERTDGWWARQFSYITRLMDADPDFRRHVSARWTFLHQRMSELQGFITEGAGNLAEAQARNFTRWPILDRTVAVNHEVRYTYAAEVDYLRSWLTARDAWLDTAFKAELPARPGN